MKCRHRITTKGHKAYFGDGRHIFYLESVCGNDVIPGETLCSHCSRRPFADHQTHFNFNHGTIDEPIPEKSKLFEGPWYRSRVATYGEPHPIYIERARAAQEMARSGKQSKPLSAEDRATAGRPVAVPTAPPKPPSKPKTSKTQKKSPTAAAPEEERPKTVVELLSDCVASSMVSEKRLVESTDTPIRIEALKRVSLRAADTDSGPVWIDDEHDLVFERLENGQIGCLKQDG